MKLSLLWRPFRSEKRVTSLAEDNNAPHEIADDAIACCVHARDEAAAQ